MIVAPIREVRNGLPFREPRPLKPFIPQFVNGGVVLTEMINIPKDSLRKGDEDRVYARLQPGELVIPKKHVNDVVRFLKMENIKLPGI